MARARTVGMRGISWVPSPAQSWPASNTTRLGGRTQRNNTSFLYDGVNSVQEIAGGSPSANILTGGVDENFLRSDISGT
jgi:hypothetical protein